MSLRVGGLASVPTNKGKRARRPSDGVVEDCGSLWRMRHSMHPQKKKAAYSFFLRYETDLPQSTSMPPTPSCYFVFFNIFYFFTFAPVCSCLACVGPIERFPPPRRARVDQRVSKHDPSIIWSVKPDVAFTDEAK